MLRDLDHPAARGEAAYDITFENVQAGERTSHLFRLANHHGGLVIGTGDLSELALGWSTYGVGDQMSHYNVNASVPKTLIQFLIRWAIDTHQFSDDANEVLESVLETEISPELIPHDDPDADVPAAHSESVVGPYELQDFFLYYILRFGYLPSKVAFLADYAWGETYCARRDQALARRVPRALLPHEPVQALGDPERAEGRHRRLALPAWRLARAERLERSRLARRTARACAGRRRQPVSRRMTPSSGPSTIASRSIA